LAAAKKFVWMITVPLGFGVIIYGFVNDYRGNRRNPVYKKNADINNKSENWKNSLFFCPGLIDAECDFIGQLKRR